MNVGRMNKKIILLSEGSSTDADGFDTISNTTLATVWADVREEKGSEVFKAGRELGTRFGTFIIRHRTDVTLKTKISYDSATWDIESLRAVDTTKRKDYLEIFARAHD